MGQRNEVCVCVATPSLQDIGFWNSAPLCHAAATNSVTQPAFEALVAVQASLGSKGPPFASSETTAPSHQETGRCSLSLIRGPAWAV